MSRESMTRIRLTVSGIVQGVGFRPFLHRLAEKYRIGGWVRNTSEGLEGELEGTEQNLEHFLKDLQDSPPPMAVIEEVRAMPAKETSDDSDSACQPGKFVIRKSRISAGHTLVSPDISICPECARELYTPSDRRYRYPFINCTNCGPRYTIIRDLPYDRERTVMEQFPMCPECEQEYHDIRSRRYHAQPDCCPACGPQVFYREAREAMQPKATAQTLPPESTTQTLPSESTAAGMDPEPFRAAQELLVQGGILAVKGIGGIHLACDACRPEAVRRLRQRKHRPEKPLAVMCSSLEAVRRICRVTPEEERLLASPARPIVLLAKKDRDSAVLRELSFSPRLGVMLPYTPLHMLLLDGTYGGPDTVVMTSGNVSGCPVITENKEALTALGDVADGFLLHNRPIENRCDDSLVMEWQGAPCFFRRSRGYAPSPLKMKECAAETSGDTVSPETEDNGGIFAMGAELKASFALGRGDEVFLSPYIGDLKNAETAAHYNEARRTYERLFRLEPSLFVCDLHPDYISTRIAAEEASRREVPLLQVQHHWAHMASCMADNALPGPCFGIIWDGTGLGTDGAVWGGEFLTGDYSDFRRTGSIRPVSLAGGDKAVREISRIALALLLDAGISPEGLISLPEDRCRMLSRLIHSSIPPRASSIGRLFDGVCSLLLDRADVSYDGEAPALVESLCPLEVPDTVPGQTETYLRELSYPLSFYMEDRGDNKWGVRIFDTRPVIRGIVRDIQKGRPPGETALRFQATLCCMALEQCLALNPCKLPVVLSGGVFQNRFLLSGITSLLEENGFHVYTHHQVSTGDEGICLGQLAIARKRRSDSHVSGNADEN